MSDFVLGSVVVVAPAGEETVLEGVDDGCDCEDVAGVLVEVLFVVGDVEVEVDFGGGVAFCRCTITTIAITPPIIIAIEMIAIMISVVFPPDSGTSPN